MAKQIKLAAQTRAGVGRSAVNKLKAEGRVPAVIYGGKQEPQALQVAARDIAAILAHASGENVLVDLEIAGAAQNASRMALIQEVQHHPLSGKVLHIDFLAVSANEKITANVPVEPFGESAGVKLGGILEQMMRTIEVECLPKDLPDFLKIDVSALNIGDTIHVSDIKLPENVVAASEATLSVFHVVSPAKIEAAEEAATAAAAATPAAPEVLKEKKDDAAPAAAGDKKGGDKK